MTTEYVNLPKMHEDIRTYWCDLPFNWALDQRFIPSLNLSIRMNHWNSFKTLYLNLILFYGKVKYCIPGKTVMFDEDNLEKIDEMELEFD